MIRRSTLVFLTCLAALSPVAVRAQASSQSASQVPASSSLIAQASGGTTTGSAENRLDVGSRGGAVSALQRRLQQGGYYSGSIDGIYGFATQRAVIDFQAKSGLEETGSLTEETWQALQSNAEPEEANSPETAPTASELPPADAGEADPVATTPPTDSSGRVLGLTLGLVALLCSFGVGFFIANRGKSAAEDEESWGEVDSNAGSPSPTSVQPVIPGTGGSQPTGLSATATIAKASGNGAASNGGLVVSASALQTSGQVGDAAPLTKVDIVEGLIGDLRNPDPSKRRKAIWELGQRGNSMAVQPLVDAMVNADSKEKSLLLAALSEIGIRSLKPMNRALAIALQDDNPEVRKNAIRDLTRIYDLVVQISQMLGHATEDEDPEVRQTATWALDQLNRIRRTQDGDASMRSFPGGGSAPIDLLSSEASIRRSQSQ